MGVAWRSAQVRLLQRRLGAEIAVGMVSSFQEQAFTRWGCAPVAHGPLLAGCANARSHRRLLLAPCGRVRYRFAAMNAFDPTRSRGPQDEELGLRLLAGGAVVSVLAALARSRLLGLVGFVASLIGVVAILRGRLEQREEQILSAEDQIRSQLDDLDPLARARVLKDLAEAELSPE